MKTWIKGGLIGACLNVIFVIFIFVRSSDPEGTSFALAYAGYPLSIILFGNGPDILWLYVVFGIIYWFIIGAIVGAIIGFITQKVKSRKK